MVTVGNYPELSQALLVKSRLEAEGIPAFIPDEFMAQTDWMMITAIGGIRVQVPDQLEEEAVEIVQSFKFD